MTELTPEDRVWNLVRGALGTRALAVEHIEDGLIQASVARSSGAADGSGPEGTV